MEENPVIEHIPEAWRCPCCGGRLVFHDDDQNCWKSSHRVESMICSKCNFSEHMINYRDCMREYENQGN